jgi:hypothetical protein
VSEAEALETGLATTVGHGVSVGLGVAVAVAVADAVGEATGEADVDALGDAPVDPQAAAIARMAMVNPVRYNAFWMVMLALPIPPARDDQPRECSPAHTIGGTVSVIRAVQGCGK